MESLLEYEALWDCAAAIPDPPPQAGGRPRQYPGWALVLFDGLCTVFTSARRTETNLPFFWPKLRERFSALYPDQPPLPVRPPRRHHWQYAKRLVGEEAWAKMRESFRDAAVATALEIGLFDPDGAGSFTHADRARLIYGDGKVVKPLSKYAAGETWVDRRTGEVKPRRANPDAAWYIVGGDEEPASRGAKPVDATEPERSTKRGKQVRGLKTCFVMGRSPDPMVGCCSTSTTAPRTRWASPLPRWPRCPPGSRACKGSYGMAPAVAPMPASWAGPWGSISSAPSPRG
jgi:hypothetical protein